MTHDPLCPLCGMTTIDLAALKGLSKRTLRRIQASRISCQCDLIAKVRDSQGTTNQMDLEAEYWIGFKDGQQTGYGG